MVTLLGLTGYERDCSMGNSSIARGTISIQVFDYLTVLKYIFFTYIRKSNEKLPRERWSFDIHASKCRYIC